MKMADDTDLAAMATRMRGELGVRERRVDVLLSIGSEYLHRGDLGGGKAILLEALEEARRGGESLLKDALGRASALWALQTSKK